MSFKPLQQAWQTAKAPEKAAACIEYGSLSGAFLGSGHMAQEYVFSLKGDGQAEFLRRGDFAERGDVPPGLWRTEASPAQVEKAWSLLADLTAASFPARAADPGDTVNRISAYVPGLLETLSWGPPQLGVPAPGDAFLGALFPLMTQAVESGECEWSVEMAYQAALRRAGGVDIRVGFRNPGRSAIGLYLPKMDGRGGFTLRYAEDRDEKPGVTPLPVEWQVTRARVTGREHDSLWSLAPKEELTLVLSAPIELKSGVKYIGKLQFEQVTHLDILAGARILSGACFSEVFEFEV